MTDVRRGGRGWHGPHLKAFTPRAIVLSEGGPSVARSFWFPGEAKNLGLLFLGGYFFFF